MDAEMLKTPASIFLNFWPSPAFVSIYRGAQGSSILAFYSLELACEGLDEAYMYVDLVLLCLTDCTSSVVGSHGAIHAHTKGALGLHLGTLVYRCMRRTRPRKNSSMIAAAMKIAVHSCPPQRIQEDQTSSSDLERNHLAAGA